MTQIVEDLFFEAGIFGLLVCVFIDISPAEIEYDLNVRGLFNPRIWVQS